MTDIIAVLEFEARSLIWFNQVEFWSVRELGWTSSESYLKSRIQSARLNTTDYTIAYPLIPHQRLREARGLSTSPKDTILHDLGMLTSIRPYHTTLYPRLHPAQEPIEARYCEAHDRIHKSGSFPALFHLYDPSLLSVPRPN